MDKYSKKLYYRLFDLYQYISFLGEQPLSHELYSALKIIMQSKKDWKAISKPDIIRLGISHTIAEYITEFRDTGDIQKINFFRSYIADWICDLILPGYFDNYSLGQIIRKNSIETRDQLVKYLESDIFIDKFGVSTSQQYIYLIKASDWTDFPYAYDKSGNWGEMILHNLGDLSIKGNFHNHTTFSDGRLNLSEIISLAREHHREFIGISDHSKRVNGVTENTLDEQLNEIDKIQTPNSIRIFKSVECEILVNGDLDLHPDSLNKLDYVIAGIHSDANLPRQEMEHRLIRAIENPYTKILAHPSARILNKKPPINVDMYKIIDACIRNNVVIEINGDPSRLDLDPKYIEYALGKGAYFTLDSDTHSRVGFFNINNAILIAEDYHIPPQRCLNTFTVPELEKFFKSQK